MQRRITALLILIFLCALGCSKGNPKAENKEQPVSTTGAGEKLVTTVKSYRLLVSPCGRPSMVYSKFKPFADYLSKATGLEIKLIMPVSFDEFVLKLKGKKADLVFMDPGIYIAFSEYADKENLYIAICGFIEGLKGKALETGCILALAESNIKGIEDAKGKKVIFGPKESATTWIAPKRLFEKNGIDLDRDLAQYSFGSGCMDIILDIFYKKGDVGCVSTLMCPICNGSVYYERAGLDIDQLTHVAKTDPVITWVLTCIPGMDKEDMDLIAATLMAIPGLKDNRKEGLPEDIRYGFIKGADKDFDGLRRERE